MRARTLIALSLVAGCADEPEKFLIISVDKRPAVHMMALGLPGTNQIQLHAAGIIE